MAIRKHSQLAIWSDSNLGLSVPKLITECSAVKSCNFAKDWGIFISDNGESFKIHSESLSKVLLERSIKHVSCNFSMACLISASGQVFVMGSDPFKWGLLGIPSCFETSMHLILPEIHALGVSVGQTHVGLLDRSGNIYTWGSGRNGELGTDQVCQNQLPTIVQSAKIFSVKQILCGFGFTVICTAGGFVYIYGKVDSCPNHCEKSLRNCPYSVKGLEKMFVSHVVGCEKAVGVLTDTKDVYLFHDCLKLVKLPYKYKQISANGAFFHAITKEDGFLHQWNTNANGRCSVEFAEAKTFYFDNIGESELAIFNGNSFAMAFNSHLKNEGKSIVKQFGNIRLQKEMTVNQIKDMRRYSHNDALYKKYISPSKEDLLLRAVKISSRLIQKNVRKMFLKFKEYCSLQKFSLVSHRISDIVNILAKVLQRNRVICLGKGLKSLLGFKVMVEKYYFELKIKKMQALVKVANSKFHCKKADFFAVWVHCLNVFHKKQNGLAIFFQFFNATTQTNLQICFDKVKEIAKKTAKFRKAVNKIENSTNNANLRDSLRIIHAIYISDLTKTNVINRILMYSEKKNSRASILKFFEIWKRHRVSSKIAEISKKYSCKTNARGIAMKIYHIMRRQYKYGFNCIKDYHKPLAHQKYGLMFLTTPLKKCQHRLKSFAFKSLHSEFKCKQKFAKALKSLLKSKISVYYKLIKQYLEERKQYCLMKLNLKITGLYDKHNYRLLARSFTKMKVQGLKGSNSEKSFTPVYKNSESPLSISIKFEPQMRKSMNNFGNASPVMKPNTPAGRPSLNFPKHSSLALVKKGTQKSLTKSVSNSKVKAKTEEPKTSVFSANKAEKKNVFENLLEKTFDSDVLETQSGLTAKKENSESIEPNVVQTVNSYKEDFEEASVKYELGATSLEKTLAKVVCNLYFGAFTELKKPQKPNIQGINLDFLNSSDEEDSESYKIDEIVEENDESSLAVIDPENIDEEIHPKFEKSPWVLQLQNLGSVIFRNLVINRLKQYFCISIGQIINN